MLSVRDPIRRRQPIERPLDIVGLELLVTITQALLAGILLSLAAQLGGDARAYGLPIPGLLAVLAIAVGVGWLRWLVGGSGVVMAAVALAIAILTGALWLLALQDPSLPRIDWLVGLIGATCAVYGLIAGVFLDGPHRAHWKGGVSQPRRGVLDTRAKPARFSPPVQKVVDERLTTVRLPRVSVPSTARLKAVSLPRPTRGTTVAPDSSTAGSADDGLSVAADVAPQAPADTHAASAVAAIPEPDAPAGDPAPVVEAALEVPADPEPPEVPADPEPAEPAASAAPAESAMPASTPPALSPHDATEVVAPGTTDEAALESPDPVADATHADPDAPTQPIARPAAEWPRPIEPRTRTGAHRVDPEP